MNDAPQGTSKTVTTNEDVAYTFAAVDFGFSDPNDNPPNALYAVKTKAAACMVSACRSVGSLLTK